MSHGQAITRVSLTIPAHLTASSKNLTGWALSALSWCLAESKLERRSRLITHMSTGKDWTRNACAENHAVDT